MKLFQSLVKAVMDLIQILRAKTLTVFKLSRIQNIFLENLKKVLGIQILQVWKAPIEYNTAGVVLTINSDPCLTMIFELL